VTAGVSGRMVCFNVVVPLVLLCGGVVVAGEFRSVGCTEVGSVAVLCVL
jgi:hypothetical protein